MSVRTVRVVLLAMMGASLAVATPAAAQDKLAPRAEGEPIFVHWLKPSDPGDRTIRKYWQRMERGEASGKEQVDLGTMLFFRGFPRDAVRVFERAGKADRDSAEPWFRAGLVEHAEGNLRAARKDYKRCLKARKGNGWCNFYMGLVEEQMGRAHSALEHYRRAFRVAPELADPKVNPEVLQSKLELGAVLREGSRVRFVEHLPIDYLEPHRIYAFRSGRVAGQVRKPATKPPVKPLRRRPAVKRPPRSRIRVKRPSVKARPTPNSSALPYGVPTTPPKK